MCARVCVVCVDDSLLIRVVLTRGATIGSDEETRRAVCRRAEGNNVRDVSAKNVGNDETLWY